MPAPKVKLPPPTTFPDDEPLVCIKLNAAWIPYIIGAIRPMKYPEYWAGTLEENRFARQCFALLVHQLSVIDGCEDDMSGCDCFEEIVTTILHRLSSDGSTFELSVDGGETWVPDPADPRSSIPDVPSPNTPGSKAKCDAADNIVQGLKEAQTIISDTASGEGSLQALAIEIVTALLALLLLPPAGVVLLVPLIIGIVRHFLSMGKAAYDALFTEERWDIVRCAFYCAVNDDGHLSAEGMQRAKNYIYSHIPGDNTPTGAAQNIVDVINFVGLAGLNLIAMTYQASGADCSDCECENCVGDFQFQTLPYHWMLSAVSGTWQAGKGWTNTKFDNISEYYTQITIPMQGCYDMKWQVQFHHEQAPFDHKGIDFLYEDAVTGEKTWTANGFNLGGGEVEVTGEGSTSATLRTWAARITLVSVNGSIGKGTMWLKRFRWNMDGIFE